jgi:hypothetical protein
MCDFAELLSPNTLFANGLTGERMHNFYTYFYAKAYFDSLSELTNNDFLTYIRGASAGTQKWSAIFSGDQYASWDGLKSQMSAGLSVSASGFSVWGGDIAGLDGKPTDEVYIRGLDFAVFQPLMRTGGNESKLPTDYGSQVQDTYKRAYWLRENLLNMIYSSAVKSHITGLPMMQAMGLAFPGEMGLYDVEDQYVFCDDLLVSPVFADYAYYRNVKLPEGAWYDLWDGKKSVGGKTEDSAAPYYSVPVYVKSGAVIPVTVDKNFALAKPMNEQNIAEALLVTPPDGSRKSVFYRDENTCVSYSSAPVSKSAFRVSAGNGNTAGNIIVNGVSAYSVTVDGQPLKRLTQKPTDGGEVGYYVESNTKTLIALGKADWKTADIQLGSFEPTNVAKSFSDPEAEVLLDETFQNTYYINSSAGDELVVALAKETEISSVVLKWTQYYASEYAVETSPDGSVWNQVASVKDALGGIETISFEPVGAKYVRLSGIVSPGVASPGLYGIEVNKVIGVIEQPEDIYPDDNPGTGTAETDPESAQDNNANSVGEDNQEDETETIIVKKPKEPSAGYWLILGMAPWLFITVISVLAVGGGTVAYVLFIKKKKKTKTNAPEEKSAE